MSNEKNKRGIYLYSKKFIIVSIYLAIVCQIIFSQEFLGEWEVANISKDFRGVVHYGVFIKYEEYYVKVFNSYESPAFYDKENHILYFVMEGVGPGRELMRFTLENNNIRASGLNNVKWVKYELYKKVK